MNQATNSVVNQLMSIETECEPVFVVGMNGSGTSMMLDSLGRHPELFGLPDEMHMIPYIVSRSNRFGDLSNEDNFLSYWRFAIDNLPMLQRKSRGIRPKIPDSWQSFPRTPAGVLDGIFSTLAAQQGKRRWCEKTPDHVQHLPMLSGLFPKGRFIHMIRDGREVACSINRRQLRTPELVAYRWKKLVLTGRADGKQLGDRYLEVRYEDLTADPERQMRRICEFLSLDFVTDVLESRMPQSVAKRSLRPGQLGSIGENPVKWPQYFDARRVRRLEQICGETLASLGYALRTEPGDVDPSALKRTIWRFADYLRLTKRRMMTNDNYKSISKLFRNLLFAYKEFRTKKH